MCFLPNPRRDARRRQGLPRANNRCRSPRCIRKGSIRHRLCRRFCPGKNRRKSRFPGLSRCRSCRGRIRSRSSVSRSGSSIPLNSRSAGRSRSSPEGRKSNPRLSRSCRHRRLVLSPNNGLLFPVRLRPGCKYSPRLFSR